MPHRAFFGMGGSGWGGRKPRRKQPPHRSLSGDVAGCPAPTTIAEQLHAQHGWVQTGPCQAPMGVVGRSVGEGVVALSGSGTSPSRRRWRHSRSCDTHRGSPTQAVRSQLTTPSGLSTEVPNRPSQRARIGFLAKSSVLDVSDHCTPTPGCRCRPRRHQWPARDPHQQPPRRWPPPAPHTPPPCMLQGAIVWSMRRLVVPGPFGLGRHHS